MGFCSQCHQIETLGKCGKCGDRSAGPTTKNISSDQPLSVTDRWQSQYANSILNNDSISRSKSTPLITGKSPLLSSKMCTTCKKSLQYAKSYFKGERHYCEDCYSQKFSPGACAACEEKIASQDARIAHGSQAWHLECFRCWSCKGSINEPLVDMQRRPCCKSCMVKQSSKRHSQPAVALPSRLNTGSPLSALRSASTSPVPTLGSSYSTSPDSTLGSAYSAKNSNQSPLRRPPIDSHLFRHYEKSVQSSSPTGFIPRDSDSPVPTTTTSLRSGSPASQTKPTSSTNASTLLEGHRTSTGTPPPTKPTDRRRICCECEKPLSGQRVKLPTPKGDKWYHDKCLVCTTCKSQFTGSDEDIVVDDKGVYHTKCHRASAASPKPQTSNSPSTAQVFECHTCEKPITEKCLKNGTRLFHPQCFLCHECNVVLPYDQPFYDIKEEAHCEECSNRITQGLRSKKDNQRTRSLPPPPSQHQTRAQPDLESNSTKDTHPSTLFKNRTNALPKLGGSKKCPRCNESIAVMDDTPGPKASRWHKKCLRCESCKKQMDSAAKVTEGPSGEWLVCCRTCTLKTGSQSTTRNRSYSQPLTQRHPISSVFQ